MSDEAQAALEQRLDWCEAQLRHVRKRMLSMGVLIALLAVALIWRTQAPGDLVRKGDAASFESVAFVDDMGRRAVLDARSLTFTGREDDRKTVLAAPSDGDSVLSAWLPGAGVNLKPARIDMSHANGSVELEPDQMIFLGPGDVAGQTDIGPGFVGVTGGGGSIVSDGRKDGFGLRLRDVAGKTQHLKPR